MKPNEAALYRGWLADAEELNANVLRVYTLLPPAFYRAFRAHRAAGGRITLMQQIWIDDPPGGDLFDAHFMEEARSEIRRVVDVIHGRGEIAPRRARGHGVYDSDLAGDVSAILLGREIEPSVAQQTNAANPNRSGYSGRFVSISGATATEAWFAELLDYLVRYEQDAYNWQHPVAIVNWPPLDPLAHPTETTLADEVRFRIRRGEQLKMPDSIVDDNDATSIDEAKYRISPELAAGLFASYHVYPYYPDFLINDPQLLQARDAEGPNPMLGYLRSLRAHIPYPLLVTEYGLPNSIGMSHFHPLGMHHGSHTEQGQADILARLGRTIRDAGAGGGIVFALVDEWYKQNWMTADFERPAERAAVWLNELNPEKRYGLIGYRTSKEALYGADDRRWQAEPVLLEAAAGGTDRPYVTRVQAAADEAFLHLRMQLSCLPCGTVKPGQTAADLEASPLALALNTAPGAAGIQQLPFGSRVDAGAVFLLFLGGRTDARLLISDNYNPYELTPKPGVPHETQLGYKRGFFAELAPTGFFEEMNVETNRRRFDREGAMFREYRYSRSVLRYGSADPASPDYDTLGLWYVDPRRAAVLVRIPWGMLYVLDPSSKTIFAGFDQGPTTVSRKTAGISIAVFSLAAGARSSELDTARVLESLPAAAGGQVATRRFEWTPWETVRLEPYHKKAFYAIQATFGGQPYAGAVQPVPRPQSGGGSSRADGQRPAVAAR
jgi:hypothetical protein